MHSAERILRHSVVTGEHHQRNCYTTEPYCLSFRNFRLETCLNFGNNLGLNKFVLSLAPRLSTRRYPRLLLSECAANQLSIDICCRHPRSTANQPHAAAAVDRRDRQTDGPDRYIDSAPHTMRAASKTFPVNNRHSRSRSRKESVDARFCMCTNRVANWQSVFCVE